jgi:hypothetical protein
VVCVLYPGGISLGLCCAPRHVRGAHALRPRAAWPHGLAQLVASEDATRHQKPLAWKPQAGVFFSWFEGQENFSQKAGSLFAFSSHQGPVLAAEKLKGCPLYNGETTKPGQELLSGEYGV